jgi:hypothetical protein
MYIFHFRKKKQLEIKDCCSRQIFDNRQTKKTVDIGDENNEKTL